VSNAHVQDENKNQAVILSMKYAVEDQSRTDLNYSLGTNATRRDQCSCKGEESLLVGSESAATGNCSHTIDLPRIARTASWETDPVQIWQLSLNLAVNNTDVSGFSGIPDGQPSGFADWLDSNNDWPLRDMEGLENCWEHLDIVESKKGLQMDSIARACGEQTMLTT
jgi:hypothetical protein